MPNALRVCLRHVYVLRTRYANDERQSPTEGDPFGYLLRRGCANASCLRRETLLQHWSHLLQRWSHQMLQAGKPFHQLPAEGNPPAALVHHRNWLPYDLWSNYLKSAVTYSSFQLFRPHPVVQIDALSTSLQCGTFTLKVAVCNESACTFITPMELSQITLNSRLVD
jgi:hypothetical protein